MRSVGGTVITIWTVDCERQSAMDDGRWTKEDGRWTMKVTDVTLRLFCHDALLRLTFSSKLSIKTLRTLRTHWFWYSVGLTKDSSRLPKTRAHQQIAIRNPQLS